MNSKIKNSYHLNALKAYYEEKNIETIEQRSQRYELEYQTLRRMVYGSGNTLKKEVKREGPEHYVNFESDTELGLLRLHSLFYRLVVGNSSNRTSIGNKRLGRKVYYCDLLKCFLKLDRLNIKLPRNNLSQKACEYGLIEILKKHKKIPPSFSHKEKFNSREREMIRKSNESAFLHIIEFIKYPP